MIDAHLHFWDLTAYDNESTLSLIRSEPVLNRSFVPVDLMPHFAACGVDAGVIIEAGQSHRLNCWWLELAERYDFIAAVIAGCRLEQADLSERFDEYSRSGYFAGVRAVPAGRPEEWSHNAPAQQALRELVRRDRCLEILVEYEAFPAVARLAATHPSLRIAVDTPPLPQRQLDVWATSLRHLAAYENVFVKYASYLLYWPDASIEDLRPIAQRCIKWFGIERMIWGSNWPIALLGGSYEHSFRVMAECVEPLTRAERVALFGGNARRFYRLNGA